MTDIRTRIAAAIESIRIQRDGDAARMADAVIRALGLEQQAHYDPDCPYYRYVTDWINLLTGDWRRVDTTFHNGRHDERL